MFFLDIIAALIIAVLLTSIFAGGCRRCGPGEGALFFFIIVFLAAWAGGLWITPFGPAFFGFYWIPFMFFALIVALLLAGLSEPAVKRNSTRAIEQIRAQQEAVKSVGVFFWVLIIILVLWIIFGYLWL